MDRDFKEMMSDRAVRMASHVTIAERLSIAVRSASVVEIERQPASVRLAPLREICKLAEATNATKIRLEHYAMVRLAGPVGEMINNGLRAAKQSRTVQWDGWASDFKEKLAREDDADFDLAYAIVLGWMDEGDDLLAKVYELWDRTVAIVREKKNWQRIRHLADALVQKDVMTGAEAFALIRNIH